MFQDTNYYWKNQHVNSTGDPKEPIFSGKTDLLHVLCVSRLTEGVVEIFKSVEKIAPIKSIEFVNCFFIKPITLLSELKSLNHIRFDWDEDYLNKKSNIYRTLNLQEFHLIHARHFMDSTKLMQEGKLSKGLCV